ncbi:MAG TPA: hypothetical protein PKB03_03520, partial [Baekduia sp.]|nr:hypothetical protein [Baekduia sp.]
KGEIMPEGYTGSDITEIEKPQAAGLGGGDDRRGGRGGRDGGRGRGPGGGGGRGPGGYGGGR